MAQVIIGDIADGVIERLKARAATERLVIASAAKQSGTVGAHRTELPRLLLAGSP